MEVMLLNADGGRVVEVEFKWAWSRVLLVKSTRPSFSRDFSTGKP